ncbi:DUF2231 domain-containing protein [Actinotalea sp. K2]|uniref:DUF2231 domain-containing protein n=1 Tax=Actinotalea sp. K2 TaxID=2939438 RepID=UPI002017D37D|nr:DUF2231 domain-containing protein [Actinotalea sp. K2]MCL3861339.1 DUF2231 domain-containing protein [Actinotalea sp. K2]
MSPTPAPQHAPLDDQRPAHRAQSPALVRIAERIEQDERLDGAVAALRPAAQALVAGRARRALLQGRPLGHALHPLLTDAPLGAWMSATALDVVGGDAARPAARRLVGLGVLSAVPTALTGLAEWAHTGQRDSRVGVVHAVSNTLTLALYGASYLARRRERHALGTAWGLAGALTAGIGGFLGAHLALARNVASRDVAFAESIPGDQRTVGPAPDDPA